MSQSNPIYLYCDALPLKSMGGLNAVLGMLVDNQAFQDNVRLISSLHSNDVCGRRVDRIYTIGQRWLYSNPLVRILMHVYDYASINLMNTSKYDMGLSLAIWIGSDWSALLRGYLLSKRIKSKDFHVYIVDDLLATKSENPIIRVCVNYTLAILFRKAKQRFAITKNLCTKYHSEYGGTWQYLPLPYEIDSECFKLVKSNNQVLNIVFLGSFTADVKFLIDFVCKSLSGLEYSQKYHIHVISNDNIANDDDVSKKLSEKVQVSFHKSLDDRAVIDNYGHNSIFIVGYANTEEKNNLAAYSFPSKLLKIISMGFMPFVIAPEYSDIIITHGFMIDVYDYRFAHDRLQSLVAVDNVEHEAQSKALKDFHSFSKYLSILNG